MSTEDRRLYITSIQHEEYNTDIYWDPSLNAFVFCELDEDEWVMKRTEQNLHAIAHMIGFNPKKYGCATCGCSAEFRDGECVCWCDSCKNGCSSIVELKPLPQQSLKLVYPRSQFFATRNITSSLLPPNNSAKRLMTLGGPTFVSNTNDMIMEDDDDDERSSSHEHFENLEQRMKRFRIG